MPTHIDVLMGDYESVVRYNSDAILVDNESIRHSPETAGPVSFYFGYIVHNYHMLVYGAILGGMESKAMEIAKQLNEHLTEDMFMENQNLTAYLESYSASDIHVMVRFGRWKEILELEAPRNKYLMLFRSSTLFFARGLAHANLGDITLAKKEADQFDSIRQHPLIEQHILHNNSVSALLAVDAPMLRGDIAYREGQHEKAFQLLREAVQLQDNLRYDEPWGKMQPIRHALGGLLLEQGHFKEAEEVFREDLKFHPKNPWALVGLIQCLKKKSDGDSCCNGKKEKGNAGSEIMALEAILKIQRKCEWADYNVTVACECCKHS
jgi:tetratricopeptide (TPR) repeat protein